VVTDALVVVKSRFSTAVRIVNGQIKWADREGFVQAVRSMADCDAEITIASLEDRRSVVANRYYWGVVLKAIAEETETPAEDVHDAMCDRFLKHRITLVNVLGEVLDQEVAGRSSKLSVAAFYRFVEQVRLFAAEFFGLSIPDPDPEFQRYRAEAEAA
jgi:hypothetical protein